MTGFKRPQNCHAISFKCGHFVTCKLTRWIRTFAVITTDANDLVAEIHDRMPLILAPADYVRWLSDEPDPHDLLRPVPVRADAHVADIDPGEQAGER